MYQYAVVDMRREADNTLTHNVYWFSNIFDETARRQAESKYYELLSDAAVSDAAKWSVSVVAPDGYCLWYRCYETDNTTT